MKPEAMAELILWDWLMTKASHVERVYFNRKNPLNAPVFKVKGTRRIPDLVVRINDGYKIKNYVIEVKDSSQSQNILKGDKIVDTYLVDYVSNKTKYFIEGKQIKVDGFLIASQESPRGHLFKQEEILDNFIDKQKKSKHLVATKYKIIPRREGKRTFEFVRILWHTYGKFRDELKEKPSIGILIANSEDNYSPHMMITNFKKRWSQRWWKI